ncbi:MAG TPA: c-type cytochrome [Polyangiaceae bacterium]|nr:c-type cytochrome [Polyangiaceae bacterium]
MKMRVAHLALVFGLAGAVSVGCGSDDDTTTPPKGGAGGVSGSAGKGGSGGKSGSGGTGETGNEAGSAGEGGASAGSDQGGAGGDSSGTAGSSGSGEGGSGGESHMYLPEQVERGKVLVRSVALCGGCHTNPATSTDPAGPELGGNPTFAKGNLPAPNLTDDPTGIGNWSDQEVINAIRNGVDDEGRQLNSAMPYWLFHNMNDADVHSIVAFLRSLPHSSTAVGENNPGATAVDPLAPSTLPDTTLAASSADYEAAVYGKYLVSGIAGCVKCHSPASNGLPVADFFSGVPPATATTVFAPNITPDDSGIGGWTVTDVVTALKLGTNKAGRTLCGSMPAAAKGYGGMTDADAHAIGVYITTIPGVVKTTTDPDNQNPCPAPSP